MRIVVHPLTELLDTLPSKPRQRWRTMLVEEARLRWVRTQLLGRAPGFSPGPPVVGPYRPVTLVTGPRVGTRLTAWVEGTTGVVEVDGAERLEFPDVELWWPHTHGTPRLHDVTVDGEVVGRVGFRTIENRSDGLPRPLGQRRAGLLPRRGVDAGRPGRPRRGGRRWA